MLFLYGGLNYAGIGCALRATIGSAATHELRRSQNGKEVWQIESFVYDVAIVVMGCCIYC